MECRISHIKLLIHPFYPYFPLHHHHLTVHPPVLMTMVSFFARNRRRIYMAFYARRGHDNYHTAILVSPKKAKPDDTSTWELHVRNRPNPTRPTGEEWVYDPVQIARRTGRLGALVLLGKTKMSGKTLSKRLRVVELTQDDINWNCTSWTTSAIRASSPSLMVSNTQTHVSFS